MGSHVGTIPGSGAADNAVVIAFDQILNGTNTFMLMSTTGAMDVFVTLDGTNWSTAPLSLTDLGATTQDPVLVTTANRMYGFFGLFRGVRVLQNGATAVTNAVLRYGSRS
jgi:hypothetical protein